MSFTIGGTKRYNKSDTDLDKIRENAPLEIKRYKLVILGAASAGKSSLVTYYTNGSCLGVKENTLVASFSSLNLDNLVKFDTWEVAGEERWHSFAHMYYKDAHAALIVYDVQNENSLVCAKDWIREVRKKLPENLVVAIAANKIDLSDDLCVSSAELRSFARQHGYIFMETSAKTGKNVNKIFVAIADELRSRPTKKPSNSHSDFCWSCELL